MAKTIKRKSKRTATRRNPIIKWYHKIPIFGKFFKGVEYAEAQIPIDNGTIIVQAKESNELPQAINYLAEVLESKSYKVLFLHKNKGTPIPLNKTKEEKETSEDDRAERAMRSFYMR